MNKIGTLFLRSKLKWQQALTIEVKSESEYFRAENTKFTTGTPDKRKENPKGSHVFIYTHTYMMYIHHTAEDWSNGLFPSTQHSTTLFSMRCHL